MRLLLATHNEHKRRELGRLLPHHDRRRPARRGGAPARGWGDVRGERARQGARRGGGHRRGRDRRRLRIEAAALGGAPGVRSARYAGEHATDEQNLDKLLREAPAGSALAYVCALAYVDPAAGIERLFEGRCTGRVAAEPRGAGVSATTPSFLPDDGPPADDGRADRRRRRTRSATVAVPRGRCVALAQALVQASRPSRAEKAGPPPASS